jgi:hypothetical protein
MPRRHIEDLKGMKLSRRSLLLISHMGRPDRLDAPADLSDRRSLPKQQAPLQRADEACNSSGSVGLRRCLEGFSSLYEVLP